MRKLLHNRYAHQSYFPNSDYGASGKPTAAELAVLQPFTDKLPKAVLERAFEPPRTDGGGRNRADSSRASAVRAGGRSPLVAGGPVERDRDPDTAPNPVMERLIAPYIQTLENSACSYHAYRRYLPIRERLENFDFDIVTAFQLLPAARLGAAFLLRFGRRRQSWNRQLSRYRTV